MAKGESRTLSWETKWRLVQDFVCVCAQKSPCQVPLTKTRPLPSQEKEAVPLPTTALDLRGTKDSAGEASSSLHKKVLEAIVLI